MLFRGFHFSIYYCVALTATFLLMLLVEAIPGLRSSHIVLAIIPLLIASTIEGQHFARLNRQRPSNLRAWIVSLRMSAIALVVALAALMLGDMLAFQSFGRLDLAPMQMMGGPLVRFGLIAVVVARTGYAIGLATELKGQQFSDR